MPSKDVVRITEYSFKLNYRGEKRRKLHKTLTPHSIDGFAPDMDLQSWEKIVGTPDAIYYNYTAKLLM